MSHNSTTFRAEFKAISSPVDGLSLRYAKWTRQETNPSRYVFLLNGRSEWIEKYSHLPSKFHLPSNISWVSMDHRGQGASQGLRAHVDNYLDYAQDAAAVIESAIGSKPYSLIAHSMGGLIAMMGVCSGLLKPDKVILCSPLLSLPNHPIPRFAAKPLSKIVTLLGQGARNTGAGSLKDREFSKNSLTHSYENFQKIISSPYPYKSPTFGWVSATFEACKTMFSSQTLAEISCPILLLYGSEEKVVDRSCYPEWARKATNASSFHVESHKFLGARHELLNECDLYRNPVIEKARSWIL